MIVVRRLNRKTRIALAVLIVLLLAGPIVALRNCVMSAQEGSAIVAPNHPTDDGLIRLNNGTSLFLQSPTLARKVGRWLQLNTNIDPAFEIAGGNFVPNSSELTTQGKLHAAQVAQILNADRQLHAEVLVLTDDRESREAQRLDGLRGDRLRRELLVQHVAASSVTSRSRPAAESGDYHVFDDATQQSHLFVVITR